MIVQKFFDYKFSNKKSYINNFFVNNTNKHAYDVVLNNSLDQNIYLFAPKKSGKTELINIWQEKNNAIKYENNFKNILKSKKNIAIDNILNHKSEEEIFHIINHCKSYNLKIFVSSSIELNSHEFKIKDLSSRLRSFYHIKINQPDEEMCKIIMTKLFYEKQIIIKNEEIFNFIFNRVTRTYNDIFLLVESLDKLSLEKKRQLTIPLIKEIL